MKGYALGYILKLSLQLVIIISLLDNTNHNTNYSNKEEKSGILWIANDLKIGTLRGIMGVLILFILTGNTMTKMDDLLYCGKSITRKSDRNLVLQSHQLQASQIPCMSSFLCSIFNFLRYLCEDEPQNFTKYVCLKISRQVFFTHAHHVPTKRYVMYWIAQFHFDFMTAIQSV